LKRALKTRHSGSGAWFLKDEQYLHWKSSSKSSLWLHGLAGCGKTVLLSSIVEDLQQDIGANTLAPTSPILLYFFFDFRDKRKQSLEDMARTLAYQLYYHDINIRHPLDKLLHACGDGYRKPSTESLLRVVLEFLLTTGRKVYLVLDALDECPERHDLLAWIRMIAKLTDPKIHLLITSRKEPDIDSALGLDDVIDQVVAVQAEIIDADIRAYIIDTLRTDVAFKRWAGHEDIQQMIRDSLFEKSNGM
jgi:GTPase SAR1 family protein